MGIQDKIIENAQPHLEDGEQVVAAFPAQSKNQIAAILPISFAMLVNIVLDPHPLVSVVIMVGVLANLARFLMTNKNFTVVATNKRTIVGQSTLWSSVKVDEVVREIPPTVDIGPLSGFSYETMSLGESMRIHMRFRDDVARADARN